MGGDVVAGTKVRATCRKRNMEWQALLASRGHRQKEDQRRLSISSREQESTDQQQLCQHKNGRAVIVRAADVVSKRPKQ